jgi:transposase-like protein
MPAKLPAKFTNAEAARKHLEAIQWPDGPTCPHCGVLHRSSRIEGGRDGLLFCNACRKQYTVTVGTVFERSKIPLHVWLYANHLLCSSKKGISSHQLARMLGVTYKTAWFMSHRIREAMKPASAFPPIGGEGKIVEADETFIGQSERTKKKPGYQHKRAILSLVERGGPIRSFKLDGHPTAYEIKAILSDNIHSKSRLMTDGAQFYKATGFKHESVDHSKYEWKRGDAHTNTLEGHFSIFKRGMVGTYQHCGEQHLQRYLYEFDFRSNYRVKLGFDDTQRSDKALEGIKGKRLTYRRTYQPQVDQAEG